MSGALHAILSRAPPWRAGSARDERGSTRRDDDPLKLVNIPIGELKPHPRNPRKHPPRQIGELRTSIREFDFVQNVVASNDKYILGGHGVIEAATAEGKTTIPTFVEDFDHKDPRALKLIALLNTISRLAEDDETALSALLADVQRTVGLDGTGYNDAELDALIAEVAGKQPPEEFPSYDENLETAYQCPKCGYEWSGKPHGAEE